MAERRICNGCGHEVSGGEFHVVEVSRATLPGAGQKAGALAADERVTGELCAPCWMTVKDFIGDTDVDIAHIARETIKPVLQATA